MNKIGGFGYCCCHNKHTYVTLYQTDQGQIVELKGQRSRPVPNLFDQIDGHYLMWILVKEVEKTLLG